MYRALAGKASGNFRSSFRLGDGREDKKEGGGRETGFHDFMAYLENELELIPCFPVLS